MLQMLDDGQVTDSKGVHVSFKNCIIIFTSNIGSQDILDLGGSEGDQALMKERVDNAMRANVSRLLQRDRLSLNHHAIAHSNFYYSSRNFPPIIPSFVNRFSSALNSSTESTKM